MILRLTCLLKILLTVTICKTIMKKNSSQITYPTGANLVFRRINDQEYLYLPIGQDKTNSFDQLLERGLLRLMIVFGVFADNSPFLQGCIQ